MDNDFKMKADDVTITVNSGGKIKDKNLSKMKKLDSVKNPKRYGIKYRKSGKVVQDILKNKLEAPVSIISQEDFYKTLSVFENYKSTRDIYREKCVTSIHFERRNNKVELGYFVNLLELARKCLIQKNWNGLAKVLVCAKPISRSDYNIYFSVFLVYASICLFHNPDKELLDIFLQSVLMCSSDEEKHNAFKRFVCLKSK